VNQAILVMRAAEDWCLCYSVSRGPRVPAVAGRNPFASRFRNARPWRIVRPASFKVETPFFDNHSQMAIVERDQATQTLPAKTATATCAESIRSRRLNGVRRILAPSLVIALSNLREKTLPRSWSTNRHGWLPGWVSRNCCKVHSAVGWAVPF